MHESGGQSEDGKRGRGRPRKYPIPDLNAPKRGRGRPRKLESDTPLAQAAVIEIRQPDTAPLRDAQPDAALLPESPAVGYPEFTAPPSLVTESVKDPATESLLDPTPVIDEDFWGQAAIRNFKQPRFLDRGRPKWNLKKVVYIGGGVVLLLAVAVFGSRGGGRSSSLNARITESNLLQKVGRLTELPQGEQPKIYTVTDQSKTSQPFLKNAEKGDQVLVYKLAGKAIVYRIASDKLIAVGPINVGAETPAGHGHAVPAPHRPASPGAPAHWCQAQSLGANALIVSGKMLP